jgi:tRNA-dihydrouridine synthase C
VTSVTVSEPALFLAPMEGVTDAPMRALLSQNLPFTHVVSEFLRISQIVPSERVMYEFAPELKTNSKTASGTHLVFQILGGGPDMLAASALRAVDCGAKAIDLNFGCPAPTVNRHDGGATLLKYPDRIEGIIKTIKSVLPTHITLSAKIRLGFDTPEAVYKNAESVFKGGADWLTIHARTRNQGYRPPVFWKYIGDIKKDSPIPIIANGDIWSLDDFKRCQDITQCRHYMLGRGVLAHPELANDVARELGLPLKSGFETWNQLFETMMHVNRGFGHPGLTILKKVKQWLSFRNIIFDTPCFHDIKRFQTLEELEVYLQRNIELPRRVDRTLSFSSERQRLPYVEGEIRS